MSVGAQGAGGIAGVIRFINGSKRRMTELKHEVAASTSRFRQGYQDETVLLSMLLEGGRNIDVLNMGCFVCPWTCFFFFLPSGGGNHNSVVLEWKMGGRTRVGGYDRKSCFKWWQVESGNRSHSQHLDCLSL